MITENQVVEILSNELPDINNELSTLSNSKNIYKTMQCFVDFTGQLISSGKLTAVKHCFIIAERMLDEGNNTVKNAIANVYVYSLGTVLDLSTSTAKQLKEIFNGSLKKEYYRQVYSSGI